MEEQLYHNVTLKIVVFFKLLKMRSFRTSSMCTNWPDMLSSLCMVCNRVKGPEREKLFRPLLFSSLLTDFLIPIGSSQLPRLLLQSRIREVYRQCVGRLDVVTNVLPGTQDPISDIHRLKQGLSRARLVC